MEVWYDYQINRYYKLDSRSGYQSPSNRFGEEKKRFYENITGFPRSLSPKLELPDKIQSFQPKKFDGYCQFPRPPEKTLMIPPYSRDPIKKSSKIHITNPSKIPEPLTYLSISKSNSSMNSSKSKIRSSSSSSSLKEPLNRTISTIKKSQIAPLERVVKTVTDLNDKLGREKASYLGYTPPAAPRPRLKFKGMLCKKFKTSSELTRIDKQIILLTNPTFAQKEQRREEFENRKLTRKREATKLLQLTVKY